MSNLIFAVQVLISFFLRNPYLWQMATLKLKVSDKILDKVLWLLEQFKKEDLQVIESEDSFETEKNYVQKELNRLELGESKAYSLKEVDDFLEDSISKYEN